VLIQTSFIKPSVFAVTVLQGNTRVGHEVKTALGHLPVPLGADSSLWEIHVSTVWPFCPGLSITRPSYIINRSIPQMVQVIRTRRREISTKF
jgi:hypothetical protein